MRRLAHEKTLLTSDVQLAIIFPRMLLLLQLDVRFEPVRVLHSKKSKSIRFILVILIVLTTTSFLRFSDLADFITELLCDFLVVL